MPSPLVANTARTLPVRVHAKVVREVRSAQELAQLVSAGDQTLSDELM